MLNLIIMRHKYSKSRRIARRRALFALAGLSLFALSACGLKVGNSNPYISKNNVGPHSRRNPPQQPGAQQSVGNAHAPAPHARAQTKPQPRHSQIVNMARRQIGTPYRYGGASPSKGFDCSGLIFWVYQQNGISVPRVARDQASFGKAVSKNRLQPGDIVAFRIKGGYHTGIYSGNGKFIHSPKKGSRVREESMQTAYWRRNFTGARRVL